MTTIKIIFPFLIFLISCQNYYFSNPQPADSRNIFKFPKEIRINKQDSLKGLVIEKKRLCYFSTNIIAICKQDSDRIKSYIKSGNKIYRIEKSDQLIDKDEKSLSAGYTFSEKKDSVFINQIDKYEIELNNKAFLRKVDKYYILNIKNSKDWWQLFLIDIKSKNKFLIKSINHEQFDKIKDLRLIYKTFDNHYIDNCWTKKQILEMINSNVFCDTLIDLSK